MSNTKIEMHANERLIEEVKQLRKDKIYSEMIIEEDRSFIGGLREEIDSLNQQLKDADKRIDQLTQFISGMKEQMIKSISEGFDKNVNTFKETIL